MTEIRTKIWTLPDNSKYVLPLRDDVKWGKFLSQSLAMDRITVERHQLIETVSTLPDEALVELASFLDYLRYKSAQRRNLNKNAASFLVAVAGIGDSGQQDVSEHDEEILRNDIDPVYGWNLRSNDSV